MCVCVCKWPNGENGTSDVANSPERGAAALSFDHRHLFLLHRELSWCTWRHHVTRVGGRRRRRRKEERDWPGLTGIHRRFSIAFDL